MSEGGSGQQQSGDAGRVLQSGTDDFGRIDYAVSNQIAIGIFVCVIAVVLAFQVANTIDNHGSIIRLRCWRSHASG